MQLVPRCLLLSFGFLFGACQRDATAQAVDDYAAPINCFDLVNAAGAASTTGVQVCTAATSAAPGQCFVEGSHRNWSLTTGDLAQLCHGATSLDPLACYEHLDAQGLASTEILPYCSPTCPLGPAPSQTSSASCIARAIDHTQLSTQMVLQLCQNSRSSSPVDCYAQGVSTTQLTSDQLIQLCAHRDSCQYVNQASY